MMEQETKNEMDVWTIDKNYPLQKNSNIAL